MSRYLTVLTVTVSHDGGEGDPRDAPVVTALFDAVHQVGDDFGMDVDASAETTLEKR